MKEYTSMSDEEIIEDMLDDGMSTAEILAVYSNKLMPPERYQLALQLLGFDETAE